MTATLHVLTGSTKPVARLADRSAAQDSGTGMVWREVDSAPLGQSVLLWAYGWRYPFPGRRVGDFGKVVLDNLKDGYETYATHWSVMPDGPLDRNSESD